MSDCKAAGSGIQSGPASMDLIGQVAALSCNRNGKLEKTIYSVKELFFGRFCFKMQKKKFKTSSGPCYSKCKASTLTL